MAIPTKLLLFLLNCFLVVTLSHGSEGTGRKAYIVYMGDASQPRRAVSAVNDHQDLLLQAIGDEKIATEAKIYSYRKSFNGFAAMLTAEEADRLSKKEGVISVFKNTRRKLHTSRSWDFLGMPETLKQRNRKVESNTIVALLDTGIWVDSPSFNDDGFGPSPAKWKGKCEKGVNFTGCNNKVIGARYYNLDNMFPDMNKPTPVDTEGHGTHTASTLAGVSVNEASLYGLAHGTVRGGVPSARIAMYKICWAGGCNDIDILAAFDDAIADGVDLISLSVGGFARHYFEDSIAIGAFHAARKGILTSCSGGNDGPYLSTVENVAPWIMTVAASSIDRQFSTPISLGNGMNVTGIAINTFSPRKKMYPLVNAGLALNRSTDDILYTNFSACDYGALNKTLVKGKMVYCLGSGGQDYYIRQLGGVGLIMATERTDVAFPFLIPAAFVTTADGYKIDQYINTTQNPMAVIYKTVTQPISAPFVASFSSRGPQRVSRNILKPDISAPGLDILAAWTKYTSITEDDTDNRYAKYNVISGTSMACPHASAAAAYVKTFHPSWSPAAIKSALMTTATPMKIKQDDAELGSGSGQINPIKAVHPGLVYDIRTSSYIRFLCKEGYNTTTIRLLTGGKHLYNCSDFSPAPGTDGLNYPSMNLHLELSTSAIAAVFHRTVTNVGSGKSIYKANVVSPSGLSIAVIPNVLSFDRPGQRRSFKVVVKGGPMKDGAKVLSGSLEWNDGSHSVRSPILIYRPTEE